MKYCKKRAQESELHFCMPHVTQKAVEKGERIEINQFIMPTLVREVLLSMGENTVKRGMTALTWEELQIHTELKLEHF